MTEKLILFESFQPVKLNKREATIVILEEGPGNKARKCWYGVEALESGRTIFRGAQVYADHPSRSEMEDLPERSVRDIIGRIKETWIDNGPNNKKRLMGVLKINEGKDFDWVASLIKESIQAQKEGFPPVAQVSIHADGDTAPRNIQGEQYNYVTNIKSAVSVDVVTKGGIRNSGFVNFVENALGGVMSKRMSEKDNARFRQIQQKLAENLNSEDAQFLESYLAEAEQEGDEGQENAGGEEEIFEDDEGNLYAATGEVDEAGNPVFINEAGDAVTFPEEEIIDEPDMDPEMIAGDEDFEDEYPIEEEDEEAEMFADGGNDEVSIADVAHRFPHLAHEIDQEEMGTMESERDHDIVSLKLENKLLKSRAIAETKLAESGMTGIVPLRQLVGKAPEEMDAILESAANMLGVVSDLVESNIVAANPPSLRESAPDAMVGKRLLRNSLIPS